MGTLKAVLIAAAAIAALGALLHAYRGGTTWAKASFSVALALTVIVVVMLL